MWIFAIQRIPVETCIEMTFVQWSQHVVYPPHWTDLDSWWSQPGFIISIVKIHCRLSRSKCTVSARSYVNCLLFNVNHTGQIDQFPSHIEFQANFPLQVYLENGKSSLCAEGPHHYNIFFWECMSTWWVQHSSTNINFQSLSGYPPTLRTSIPPTGQKFWTVPKNTFNCWYFMRDLQKKKFRI